MAEYYVSKDDSMFELDKVTALLRQTSWAADRPEEMIRSAMEHSVNYGVYDGNGNMAGYARIITDYTRVFYLMDVVIDEKLRGQGLGTLLLDAVMEDVGHLWGILHTEDACGFYEKYGFTQDPERQKHTMEKPGIT